MPKQALGVPLAKAALEVPLVKAIFVIFSWSQMIFNKLVKLAIFRLSETVIAIFSLSETVIVIFSLSETLLLIFSFNIEV